MSHRRLLLAFLVAACGDTAGTPDSGPDLDPGCNPLGEKGCVLPLPSSLYERADATSATGVRLDLSGDALPRNAVDVGLDVAWLNRYDGFSASAPILTAFPDGVDPAPLPPITDPGRSLELTSPTVIVDMTTGARVPHFAEVDVKADAVPHGQALLLRPVVRLTEKRRYAVGITRTLHARSGGALPVPAGFRAILDGTPTTHARLERVRAGYPAVLAALAAAGVARENLVVAWDFTVGSDAFVQSDLLGARDAALAAMGPTGENLTFSIDTDVPGEDPALIARYLEGSFDAPQVLSGNAGDDSVLLRDAEGRPRAEGTYRARFYAEVPVCAADRKPVPVVIYGHGLMGAGREIKAHNVEYLANTLCAVVIATDWRGMSTPDLASVVGALQNINRFPKVVDHLVQGMIDFIALEHIVRGPMATSTELGDLIDPTRVYYYGNSQGGIYGATFMAYDPFVVRGVLGVPGANYALLLERSSDWPTYQGFFGGAYPWPLDQEILLHLIQIDWDRVDPISTAAGLVGHAPGIPGTPTKQILMMEARGDSQVANIATEIQARTMQIPLLGPSVTVPWGMTPQAGPLGSALTIYDEHRLPTPPLTNTALPDNGAHGSLRGREAAQRQMRMFLETGMIVQTCTDGIAPVACDCPTDAVCGPQI